MNRLALPLLAAALCAAAPPKPAKPEPPAALRASGPPDADGFAAVDWNELGDYDIDVEPTDFDDIGRDRKPPRLRGSIPQSIKALDGRKLALRGYVVPLDQEADGSTARFMLLRSPVTCCFGDAARLNQYAMVEMPPKTLLRYSPYTPVTVRGTLAVGAIIEDGIVSGLYRLAAHDAR